MATKKSEQQISDEAVKERTGKTLTHWFSVLDKAGAAKMNHTQIARYLYDKKLIKSGWWCQMVTVQYERTKLGRDKHERPNGYEISASKTINVSTSKAFALVSNEKSLHALLGLKKVGIRTTNPNKTVRLTWLDDNKNVYLSFVPQGRTKVQVVATHGTLKNKKAAEAAQKLWRTALVKLQKQLE